MTYRMKAVCGAAALAGTLAACASLSTLIQPPRFDVGSQGAELRLLGPGTSRPLGGVALRIYARVQNPNAFGLTVSALQGNVFLENMRAGDVTFPLGLPLPAGGDTIVPLDFNVSFADVPGLLDIAERIATRNTIAYRLDGTLSVDAGAFGQPSFGPTTWLSGQTRVLR